MQITFNPSLGPVSLLKYSLEPRDRLPIRGFYQMRELSPSHAKVLVQLKLADAAANQFETCCVEIPFPSRHSVLSLDLQPTVGAVNVDPKRKNVVVWNIGGKLSSKSLEAALSGSISFDEVAVAIPAEDALCVKSTGYARVLFKIPDYALSGLNVSSSGVTVNPKPSVKKSVSISRIVESGEYTIWNSLGEAIFAISPESEGAPPLLPSQSRNIARSSIFSSESPDSPELPTSDLKTESPNNTT
eukprot:TRINITY_DN1329_c0_g1_i4.p2 TRINITY_DN1329_c0_g1~~TRINITY_DN1329_c0_g1_i4.p2  ORF type:complete len:244 (-),score=29.01 TRINITY_DN1329_c0_g1_i4:40-771(-)